MTTATSPHATTLPRLLMGLDAHDGLRSLRRHLDYHGELPVRAEPGRPDQSLLDEVRASGLGGRGGAMFPASRKVDAVLSQRGRPVVVINAAEGEPPSRKDHVLLRGAPHLIIDGAVVCAALVGAREATIALEDSSRREYRALEEALYERAALHRNDDLEIRLQTVPDGFVVGEERALINALNGGPGKPTHAPPRPFEKGFGGAPTLVQNAETAAQLALIARYGAGWFRSLGTDEEPGSALVTLTGAVTRPGVYEIPIGASLQDLLVAADGLSAPVQAYLIGGYIGTWIGARDAEDLVLSNAALRPFGAALGARAIVALPESACGVAETARVARYMADQSAGQCGPCVLGLDAIAGGMERLARGDGGQLAHIHRWLGLVAGRGECRHPDGAAKLIASALTVFEDEIALHVRERKCTGDGTPVLPIPNVSRTGRRT
jgi:NADH:ubiquinone oxidoreductase subunit F (NADH-binding)